ncbi:MAG: DUF523 domain-containing protein [Erysipelotrichaceae bacterium]|nr:DUF523 domain-containing protein [Erysipelotrichaceae bacterium]
MEKILISACLVGDKTRYDGGDNYAPFVEKLREKYELIPFCPEVAGGLSIPREPCEIRGADVVTKDGASKASEYQLGAKKALEACRLFGISIAILKESSPSCGVRNVYDGRFRQTKIEGKGVTTRLLEANGIHVYSSLDDLSFLWEETKEEPKQHHPRNHHDRPLKEEKVAPKRSFKDKAEHHPSSKKPFSHHQKSFSHKKPFGHQKPFSSKPNHRSFAKRKTKEK